MFEKREIERIKDAADIVATVEAHGVSLRRSGANYVGSCPFHAEKTPSFMVYPGDRHYHCFGCGAHGDVVDFVSNIKGVSFVDALSFLAEGNLGAAKPSSFAHNRGERAIKAKSLHAGIGSIYEEAYEIFRRRLLNAGCKDEVVSYLRGRGFALGSFEKVDVGSYDPDVRNLLVEKYGKDALKGTGLISYGMGFNYRIIIPHRDEDGAIVGFVVRLMHPGKDGNGEDLPKYRFTPRLNKDIPFNFCFARKSIKITDSVIVVEGHFDALLLRYYGIDNVIAVGGNALSEANGEFVRKAGAKNVFFALDNDEAGRKGRVKSITTLLGKGLVPYVVEIPLQYKDVNDFFMAYMEHPSPAKAFMECVSNAVMGWKWYGSYLGNTARTDIEKEEAVNEAMNNIYPHIEDSIHRKEFMRAFSKSVGFSMEVLKKRCIRRTVKAKPNYTLQYLDAVSAMISNDADYGSIVIYSRSFYRLNRTMIPSSLGKCIGNIVALCNKMCMETMKKFVNDEIAKEKEKGSKRHARC